MCHKLKLNAATPVSGSGNWRQQRGSTAVKINTHAPQTHTRAMRHAHHTHNVSKVGVDTHTYRGDRLAAGRQSARQAENKSQALAA